MPKTMHTGTERAADDYRHSHLASGQTYDAVLAGAAFDAYMARLEDKFLRRTVPVLFPAAPPRYLDFACGTGRITRTVAPLCAEAVGVDVSESMLEQARAKCPGVRFVRADLTQADIDLGRFDLATAFRFFGNAQDSLREAVLAALRRALRPGAYLVINSHRNPLSIALLLHKVTGGRDTADLHWFKLRSLLRRHGFEIQQVLPIGAWMMRSSMLATEHNPRRAARLERRFGSPLLAPFAPDVVVVARLQASAQPG